ncbi:hypothetical protein KC19_6G015400 [Ceratodon purpureus]|uniref:Uncharacterized protein n=1 Tax=Ceratodon purpureus TaxID=3225 RepID=A0A8T0HDI2_CERPU|nr:hypothetical protein KC19_6G015400 [Ceratodon purpureus]
MTPLLAPPSSHAFTNSELATRNSSAPTFSSFGALEQVFGTMAYSQVKLDAAKAAAAAAGPCMVEELKSCEDWKEPAFFTCTSGVLLWGQLPTVMEGSLKTTLDSAFSPYQPPEPGFDMNEYRLQHSLHYRAPARKGLWKAESRGPIGYVCHHVDVNGKHILRRAARVGISRFEDHVDRDIVFVNYGDWSGWGCPAAGHKLMTELMKPMKKRKGKTTPANPRPLKIKSSAQTPDDEEYSSEYEEDDEEDEEEEDESDEEWPGFDTDTDEERNNAIDERENYEEALIQNRFMLVDEQGFPQLVQSLRDGFKLHARNYLFKDNKKSIAESAPASQEPDSISDAFGVNLCIGYDESHNGELGWLVFQNGELVGFVYDGFR